MLLIANKNHQESKNEFPASRDPVFKCCLTSLFAFGYVLWAVAGEREWRSGDKSWAARSFVRLPVHSGRGGGAEHCGLRARDCAQVKPVYNWHPATTYNTCTPAPTRHITPPLKCDAKFSQLVFNSLRSSSKRHHGFFSTCTNLTLLNDSTWL